MKNKKYIKIISIICMLVFIFNTVISPLSNFNTVLAKIYDNLPVSYINEVFPDSYKPYIEELKKIYPNSVFKAVHTNVDWNLLVKHESYETNLGISTIYKTNPDEWKYRPNGHDINIDGGYVTASKEAVKYVLDPRNFLTKQYVFQFESLNYSHKTSSLDSVAKVLNSTPMSSNGKYSNKYKNNGKWLTMDNTYAGYIYEAGKINDISPIHIATRIIQETSGDIVENKSINGSYPGLTGLYNFFNIGATPDKYGNNAVRNGLLYSKKNGWTTPGKSIIEGSKMLASKYIKWGQNTIYFQKFDVNNPGHAVHLFGSQYMTHILAPRSESILTYSAYQKAGMLDSSFEFHIPVYLNMPIKTIDYPGTGNNIAGKEEATPLNIKVYLDDKKSNGIDVFKFRNTPTSSNDGNVISLLTEEKEGMENRQAYELISKNTELGFAKIRLSNGLEGYISLQYIHEYKYTKVESLTLEKNDIKLLINDTYDLKVKVNPTNAKFKDLIYTSSDNSIATVDATGKIIGKKVGKVDITIKNEDSGKTIVAKVEVVSNIQKIEFLNKEYKVYVNDKIGVTPQIINGLGKEYELSIEDKSVATIENGKIKGLKIGTTNIIAKIKNTNITAKVKLNVVKNDIKNPVIFDESLNIYNTKYLTKISTEMTVKTLKDKINTQYKIEVLNKDNKVLKDTDIIGTGTKVKIVDDKDLKLEYTVIIYGDVNGDSKISPSDYVIVKNQILNKISLVDAFKFGADVSKDLQITPSDYVMIKNQILGKYNIEQ